MSLGHYFLSLPLLNHFDIFVGEAGWSLSSIYGLILVLYLIDIQSFSLWKRGAAGDGYKEGNFFSLFIPWWIFPKRWVPELVMSSVLFCQLFLYYYWLQADLTCKFTKKEIESAKLLNYSSLLTHLINGRTVQKMAALCDHRYFRFVKRWCHRFSRTSVLVSITVWKHKIWIRGSLQLPRESPFQSLMHWVGGIFLISHYSSVGREG